MTRLHRFTPTLALAAIVTAISGCGGPDNLINGVQNPFGYGICGLIIVVLDILALVQVWQSSRSTGDKLLWTVVIIILPLVGLAAYYFFGRK